MPSSDSPSSQEPLNPYAAPRSDVRLAYSELEMADGFAAESIRRLYLGHEGAVLSLGSLHLLGAIFGTIAVLGMFVFSVINLGVESWPAAGGVIVGCSLMTALNFALGYGLRQLLTWARWTAVASTLFGALVVALLVLGSFILGRPESAVAYSFVLLIDLLILYLLLSAKGAMVFSPGYKAIIGKTSHVKYQTSPIVKFAVALVVGLIALAVLLAVSGVS